MIKYDGVNTHFWKIFEKQLLHFLIYLQILLTFTIIIYLLAISLDSLIGESHFEQMRSVVGEKSLCRSFINRYRECHEFVNLYRERHNFFESVFLTIYNLAKHVVTLSLCIP